MTVHLVTTPRGWAYPGPCECWEQAAMQGWAFCRCAGANGGGHPQWRCNACGRARMLGCVGRIEVLNEYGGRS